VSRRRDLVGSPHANKKTRHTSPSAISTLSFIGSVRFSGPHTFIYALYVQVRSATKAATHVPMYFRISLGFTPRASLPSSMPNSWRMARPSSTAAVAGTAAALLLTSTAASSAAVIAVVSARSLVLLLLPLPGGVAAVEISVVAVGVVVLLRLLLIRGMNAPRWKICLDVVVVKASQPVAHNASNNKQREQHQQQNNNSRGTIPMEGR
jgi:predicted membrane channel-forming protein YqfA (hemolysin III family)